MKNYKLLKTLTVSTLSLLIGLGSVSVHAEGPSVTNVKEAEDYYSSVSAQLAETKQQLDELQQAVISADHNASDAFDKAVTDTEIEANQAKTELDNKTVAVSDAEKNAADAEEVVKRLEDEKSDAEKQLEEAMNGSDVSEQDIKDAEQKVAEAEEKVQAAQMTCSDAEKAVTQAQADVEEAENLLKTAQSAVKKAEDDKESADTALSDALKNLTDTEASYGINSEAYKKADEAVQKAENDLKSAEQNLETAKAEYDEAKGKFEEAEQNKSAAENALAEAEEKNAEAQEALKEAKEKQKTSEEQLKKDIAAYNQAVADAEKAHENVTNAENDLAVANQELEEAKTASGDTAQSLTEAEAAVTAAEQALADAKAQIALGSTGFFAERDEAANEIIDAGIEAAKTVGEGVTVIGAEGDATSLENMKTALAYIRECNELRASEGKDPLNVTDRMMALAQTHANMSASLWNHWTSDNRKYNIGENLAIGSDDPFDGWYTREKENYDSENGGQTGHYKNIIGNYDITGFAINTAGSPVYIQDFSSVISKYYMNSYPEYIVKLRSGDPFTIDDYEAAFMEYYNRVMGDLTSAKQALADAQARLDAVKAGISTDEAVAIAEAKVAEAEAALEQAKADADEADALVVEKEAAMDESKRLAEEASNAVANAETNASITNNAVETAKKTLTDATTSYENARNALDTASKKVTSAETAIEEKQNALDTANAEKQALIDRVNEAKARVAEKEAAVADARKAVDEAKADENAKQAAFDGKKKILADAESDLQKKNDLLSAAQSEYDKAVKELEALIEKDKGVSEARKKLDDILGKLEEAYTVLNNAKQILTAAKESLRSAEEAYKSSLDKKARAEKLEYKGINTETITDPDFEYLNAFIDVLRNTDEVYRNTEKEYEAEKKDVEAAYELLLKYRNLQINLTFNERSVLVGNTLNIKADVIPSDINQNVFWSSSDSDIADVTKSGTINTYKAGNVTINAVSEGNTEKTASCNIKVLFHDVADTKDYYFNPVYWAVDNVITKGYRDSDGLSRTFKPQNNCTREAVVTFLWRLAGQPEPQSMKSPFSDVKDSSKYYYKAVLWAVEKGITKGYSDGTFKPGATCLREHVVTFLYRYAGQPDPGVSKNPFNDVKSSDYYYKAALWANAKGIAKGYSNGPHAGGFGPKLDCLREHVVTFLYRYAK